MGNFRNVAVTANVYREAALLADDANMTPGEVFEAGLELVKTALEFAPTGGAGRKGSLLTAAMERFKLLAALGETDLLEEILDELERKKSI